MNLFANIPADQQQEVVEELLHGKAFRMERIVSQAHCSDQTFWYDQDEDELVFLLRGEACLQFEDDHSMLTLKPGDYVHIPAHQRHRVEWTCPDSPTIWLALFFRA